MPNLLVVTQVTTFQSELASTSVECARLQSVGDAQAAIEFVVAELEGLRERLHVGMAARKRLRDAAMFKPDPTTLIEQKDVDELRRLKKQPPPAVEAVVCAVCTLLMQHRRKMQRSFVAWDEAAKLLPRVDWFAFKAYDASQLLLAPEVMAAVQARLAVSTPYQYDGDDPNDPASSGQEVGKVLPVVTEAHAKKASAGIGKLFAWCDRVIANVEEVRAEADEADRRAAGTVEGLERQIRLATERTAVIQAHLEKLEAAAKCEQEGRALAQFTAAPPLEMGLAEANAALKTAGDAGVEEAALRRAAGLIEAADKAQKARDAAVAALTSLLDSPPLALPVKRAHALIGDAGKAGVEGGLIERTRQHVAAAEAAQKRREAASKELEGVAATPALRLDLDALQAAVEVARAAGVGEERLGAAQKKGSEARERQQARDDAAAALEALLSATPLALVLVAARRELERSRAVGVANELLTRAAGVLQGAKEAQERRDATQKRMQKACEAPPLLLQLEGARAAVEAARAAGVSAGEVEAATARIEQAAAAQAVQAEAVAELGRLASAESLRMDVVGARAALEAAKARGADVELCAKHGRAIDGAAKAQAACKRVSSAVEALLGVAHLELIVAEAAPLLKEARAAGASDALLSRAEAHLQAARASQARRGEARKRLEELADATPLEMEVGAARAAVEAAHAAGVQAEVLAPAQARVDAAEAAQAAREAASRTLSEVSGASPLSTSLPDARAAMKAALAAGVPKAELDEARGKIEAAGKAQGALATAAQAIERLRSEELLSIRVDEARQQIDAAQAAGVAEAEVAVARARVDEAVASQRRCQECKQALRELVSAPPLELRVDLARRALQDAAESSVAEGLLTKARGLVDAAEKAQSERDEAWARVAALVKQPPMALSVKEARAALGAARRAGAPIAQLDSAAAHFDVADHAQKALASAVAELDTAVKPPPLKVNVSAAKAAVEAARAAGAEAALLSASEEKVSAAAEAQRRRDAAIEAAQVHSSVELLHVNVEQAGLDVAAAREAGGGEAMLASVAAHVKKATALQAKVSTAKEELEKLTAPGLLALDLPAAKLALETAKECGLAADITEPASAKIIAAESAQAARDASAATVKAILQEKPLALMVEEVRRTLAAGKAAGVDVKLMEKGEAHVQVAADAQAKVASDLVALTSVPPLEMDLPKAKKCLEAARSVAGIAADVTESAAGKIEAAEKALVVREGAAETVKAILQEKPLALMVEEVRRTLAAGKAASVDVKLMEKGEAHVQVAADAQAKVASDLVALTSVPPLEMDLPKAKKCLEAARSVAGIAADVTESAAGKIEAAEKALVVREGTAAKVKAILAEAPLTLDVAAAGKTHEEGMAVGVDVKVLDEVEKFIYAAKDKQDAYAGAQKELEQLSAVAPLDVNLEAAKKARAAAEKAGVAAELIAAAAAKIDAAAKLQSVRDQMAKALESLLGEDVLKLVPAMANEAIETARRAGVSAGLLDKAKQHVAAAAKAQAEKAAADGAAKARREAASAAIAKLLEIAPLQLSQKECVTAREDGKAAGVAESQLKSLDSRMKESMQAQGKRDAAAAQLAKLTQVEALKVDVTKASAALDDAESAGVAGEQTSAAAQLIAAAKQAQEVAAGAEKTLERLLEMPLVYIDIEEARGEIEGAKKAGAAAAKLDKVAKHVDAAAEAQRQLDAAKSALTAFSKRTPLELDVAAAKATLEQATAVGVEEAYLKDASETIAAAEAAQKKRDGASGMLAKYAQLKDNQIDLEEARDVLAQAKAGGAPEAQTSALGSRLDLIQTARDAALAALEKLLVATPPLELELSRVELEVEELKKHVPESKLASLRSKLQIAQAAQQRRDDAWTKLLALADAPPGEMDVEYAQEVFKEAWEAGVDEAKLEAVVEIVEKEAEVQQKRDDALAELNEVVDCDPLDMDIGAARFMLNNAAGNGVSAEHLQAAQQLIDNAIAVKAGRDGEVLMDTIMAEADDLEDLMNSIKA